MAREMRDSPAESAAKPSGGDRPPGASIPPASVGVERRCRLADDTEVLIRSIRTVDCSACSTMLTACSQESLYSRYERVVTSSPDELASELCRPDPECERTVVGEIHHGNFPTIVGIAQLITDPAHTIAEYAVLIADPWQNKGLGSAFTDICLQLAHAWGVPRVVAEFLPSNMRMIRILEKRRFDMSRNLQEHVVSGQKSIGDNEPFDGAGSACVES
ncbi:GNAT family N-acetyltransferase [Candidatus Bipolaricaulota bacterium]